MQKYELWLDESGDFSPENEHNPKRHPSLVGGILVKSGSLTEGEISDLVGGGDAQGFAHAMDMGKYEMENRVLPALEELCRRGAKLVYFENVERIDYYSSRELYLRLLAGGLIQLMQRLAAEGAFVLDVMIAVRYVEAGEGILDKIEDTSYLDILRTYIRDARKGDSLHLPEETRLHLTILSARQERRLQLADFACNARLTRSSGKFDREMRARLGNLFEDDFIFSVMIDTSENRILARLSENNVAEALVEYYTGHGSMEKEKVMEIILNRLACLSHEQASRQLEEFSSQIVACVKSWYDFEQNEAMLKEITDHLFPRIRQREIDLQTDEARFRILYCLADMYIAEGDILHAQEALEEMRALILSMNYRIENLEHLYHYNDRMALCEIISLNFAGAADTIEVTIRTLQNIIDLLDADDTLRRYLGEGDRMRSEMMAKAYTMLLHAQVYQIRTDAAMYDQLQETVGKIRHHASFPGELRRMQQYLAKAEAEHGDPEMALGQLLESDGVSREGDVIPACMAYLDRTAGMDADSRAYNMMYYVQIMEAAARDGKMQLAEEMQKALERQKTIQEEMLTESVLLTNLQSDVKKEPVIYEDVLQSSMSLRRMKYHPMELVFWKYGAYLAWSGTPGRALDYFEKAILLCGSNPDYAMLHMIGLAVRLERFYWALTTKPLAECRSDCRSLGNTIKNRKQKDLDRWPEHMQQFVREIEKMLARYPSLKEEETAAYAAGIYRLSQTVPY